MLCKLVIESSNLSLPIMINIVCADQTVIQFDQQVENLSYLWTLLRNIFSSLINIPQYIFPYSKDETGAKGRLFYVVLD